MQGEPPLGPTAGSGIPTVDKIKQPPARHLLMQSGIKDAVRSESLRCRSELISNDIASFHRGSSPPPRYCPETARPMNPLNRGIDENYPDEVT